MNVVRKSVNIVDSCFQFTLLPFHDYFMGCLKSRYLTKNRQGVLEVFKCRVLTATVGHL